MAILKWDEAKVEHAFICLTVGAKEYKKQLKGAEALRLPTTRIEEELELNRQMRRELNPGAVEAEEDERDQAQLDLVEGATETGGSTKTRIQTPPPLNDEAIRDALLEAGLMVPLTAIRGWEKDARKAVEEWLGQVVAANTLGGTIPDEPPAIADVSVPTATVHERLELGPYMVVDNTNNDGMCFEIVHGETRDVKESLVDPFDAEYFAATLNIERLRNSEITDDEILKWAAAGPWAALNEADGDSARWFIQAGKEIESCSSEEDAWGTAARYNRNIAQRGGGEGWTEPQPPAVDADAVQEIKAAQEAGSDGPDAVQADEILGTSHYSAN